MIAAKPWRIGSAVFDECVSIYGTVLFHEKYVHHPAGRPSSVSPRILKTYRNVGDAITVKIAYAGNRVAKVAPIIYPPVFAGVKGLSGAYRRPMVYSFGGFFCTVVIQKYYVNRAILISAACCTRRGNVGYSIAVYIPDSCNRAP